MNSDRLYSEIIEEFEKAKNKEQRIAVLRKYDHPRFRQFLIFAFDPRIEFDVQIPKYRPAVEPAGLNYAYLISEMPKLYRFIVGHPARPVGMTQKKQQQLLLVVLESLHKDEAALLVKMLQKNLNVKHLTADLIKEAFPGI